MNYKYTTNLYPERIVDEEIQELLHSLSVLDRITTPTEINEINKNLYRVSTLRELLRELMYNGLILVRAASEKGKLQIELCCEFIGTTNEDITFDHNCLSVKGDF